MNTPENRKNKKLSNIIFDVQALELEEAELHRDYYNRVTHIRGKKYKLLRQGQELLNGGELQPALFD